MNLNNKLDKIKLYAFNKQDLIILLSVYNTAYLVFSTILKGHLIACFIIAVLVSLITLFVIVWIDLIKKSNDEENKIQYENELVRKKIRDEYQKIYRKKIKNELLIKAGCLPPEDAEKTIVVDHDEPPFSLNKDFEKVKKEVHFDYIEHPNPQKKIRGQPEGT